MKYNKWIITFFILTTLNSTCENSGKNEYKTAQNNPFSGTWQFISLKGESTDGNVFLPYGEDLFGRLMYTSEGYMSVLLMKPDRPPFQSGDVLDGTYEEIKTAFEGFDAYCGTYKVDSINKTVTHLIEGGRFPNWIGSQQIRQYEITGDTLILSATLFVNKKEWSLKAVLRRLSMNNE